MLQRLLSSVTSPEIFTASGSVCQQGPLGITQQPQWSPSFVIHISERQVLSDPEYEWAEKVTHGTLN